MQKIKKYVPNLADYSLNEGISIDVEFKPETIVDDLKMANKKTVAIENEMNTKLKNFQNTKNIDEVKATVKKYVDAMAQEKYLSILNGISSQSNNQDNLDSQNQQNQQNTTNSNQAGTPPPPPAAGNQGV